jgi:hypothetical protein
MRPKSCPTIVNKGLWYSGGPEKPKVSWKKIICFLKKLFKSIDTCVVHRKPADVRGLG